MEHKGKDQDSVIDPEGYECYNVPSKVPSVERNKD